MLVFSDMNNFSNTGGGGGAQTAPPPQNGPGVVSAGPQLGENYQPGNVIQARELLYRLMISQLFYDGYQQVAVTLSNISKLWDNKF